MADVIDSLCVCVCRFVLRFRRESKLKREAAYYFTQIVRPVGWDVVGGWGLLFSRESSMDICYMFHYELIRW